MNGIEIKKMPAGDVVMLHGCCHNPTGIDPTPEQWKKLADVIYEQNLLPLLDFAYQGFADGIAEDAAGLRELARPGAELIVCSSFSKNFGLYCERVGALTVVAKDKAGAETVQSQVKVCIRSNYSNPPAHGAELVGITTLEPYRRRGIGAYLTAYAARTAFSLGVDLVFLSTSNPAARRVYSGQ